MVEETTATAVQVANSSFEEEAQSIIKKHTAIATAAGMIPLPGLDIAAVTAVQIQMVRNLSELHGINADDHLVRLGVSSLVTTAAARAIAIGIREALNSFNQFGKWGANLTNSAVSGFFTMATGEIYHAHFSAGGTIESLDMVQFIDYFGEQIKEGKLDINSFTGLQSGFRYLF